MIDTSSVQLVLSYSFITVNYRVVDLNTILATLKVGKTGYEVIKRNHKIIPFVL